MTTQTDLDAANTVVDDFEVADEKLRTTLLILLAEYDIDSNYEVWCQNQHVEADNPKHAQEYYDIHMFYLVLWDRLGTEAFFKQLEEGKRIVRAWRNRKK